MLARTEDVVQRSLEGLAREAEEDRIAEYAATEMRLAVYMDTELDPTNLDKQLGNALTPEQFETRLTKLVPTLKYEQHPTNHTKRCAYILDRRGKYCVCVYENSIMPERSWFSTKTRFVQDPAWRHIERADVPKHDFIEDENGNMEMVFEPGVAMAGFIKIKEPGREIVRGWRTVLLRVLLERLTTIDAIEREFSADNSATWAGHTGKAPVTTPW